MFRLQPRKQTNNAREQQWRLHNEQKLSDEKILSGVKYYLAQNIYLVRIFSAAMEARETTQASSNDTCTTSRGGSTSGCTTTSGEKIWCKKNIIWWCGKLSTTGCTATSETPVLLALQFATCTTCSLQQQLKLSGVKNAYMVQNNLRWRKSGAKIWYSHYSLASQFNWCGKFYRKLVSN